MKIINNRLYTYGVILLTLHITAWIPVVASGFSVIRVIDLCGTFLAGTFDITHSIKLKEEEDEQEKN